MPQVESSMAGTTLTLPSISQGEALWPRDLPDPPSPSLVIPSLPSLSSFSRDHPVQISYINDGGGAQCPRVCRG